MGAPIWFYWDAKCCAIHTGRCMPPSRSNNPHPFRRNTCVHSKLRPAQSQTRKWYSVSVDGLVKAAENIGKVGEPVIDLSRKVLSLLTGGVIK
jgi:hypothetical protein